MKGLFMLIGSLFHRRATFSRQPPPGCDVSKAVEENVSAMRRSEEVAKHATVAMRKNMLPINELMQRIGQGDAGCT